MMKWLSAFYRSSLNSENTRLTEQWGQKTAELVKLYRDIFAEITAKAVPVCDPSSDDPERVRYYRIPVGPIHRAAGKLGFQMFDGEAYLNRAVARIRELEGRVKQIPPTGARVEIPAESVGMSLKMDDETRRDIEEIERNSRSAAFRAKDILFD